MQDLRRARKVGICAIILALCLRLWSADLPQLSQLNKPMTQEKTGQDVRFSSSSEVFVPDFVESPPPALQTAVSAPLPAFSGTETVAIRQTAGETPDLPALLTRPLSWDLSGEEPTVLILHTHTTESYTEKAGAYRETSPWRTLEESHNMLSIGRHLALTLAQNGITSVQDQTVHDYPSYNGAYTHARRSIQEYLEKYPTIQLVLDLHRDASGTQSRQMRTQASFRGETAAQLMIVLGTNHESYEENLSLAVKIHAQLENQTPGITRPLQLRGSRFNQDLHPGALLIEVGAAGNSHTEALLAAEALAQTITALAKGTA